MAAYDVERQDSLSWFRTEVSPTQYASERQAMEIQRQREKADAMTAYTVLALIGLAILVLAVMKRRRIARAADTVVVAGLATGVRAARKAATKRDALVARVMAKADETTPKQD